MKGDEYKPTKGEMKAHFAAEYHYKRGFELLHQAFEELSKAVSFSKRSKRNTMVRNAEMAMAFIEGALRNLGLWKGGEGGGR